MALVIYECGLPTGESSIQYTSACDFACVPSTERVQMFNSSEGVVLPVKSAILDRDQIIHCIAAELRCSACRNEPWYPTVASSSRSWVYAILNALSDQTRLPLFSISKRRDFLVSLGENSRKVRVDTPWQWSSFDNMKCPTFEHFGLVTKRKSLVN